MELVTNIGREIKVDDKDGRKFTRSVHKQMFISEMLTDWVIG